MFSMLLCFSGSRADAQVTFERFGKVLDWFGPWEISVREMRKAVRAPWFFGDQSFRKVRVALAGMETGILSS